MLLEAKTGLVNDLKWNEGRMEESRINLRFEAQRAGRGVERMKPNREQREGSRHGYSK